MKGKSKFTEKEAAEIILLIEKKLVAGKEEQKKIRDEIRALGFYMTDFSNRKKYTTEDFMRVVKII